MKLLYLGFFSILKYQVSTLVYNNFVFVLDFYISDYVRFHPAYSAEYRRKKNSKLIVSFKVLMPYLLLLDTQKVFIPYLLLLNI